MRVSRLQHRVWELGDRVYIDAVHLVLHPRAAADAAREKISERAVLAGKMGVGGECGHGGVGGVCAGVL